MAISHRQAKLYIDMALDDKLSPAMQARLDDHLATCADCRDYAQEWMQFDNVLTRSLAGVGAAPPASPQKVGQTLAVIAARRQRWRFWQPFQMSGRLVMNGTVLLALIVAVFWFLRPPETAVDSPTVTPQMIETAVPDTIAAFTSDYIVVHFDFGGSSDGLELVHPACDGMASLPQPNVLAQAAASGETPYCELITSSTLLFKPGESRQILLVYRSSHENEIALSLTPQTVTDLNRPFVRGICHQDTVAANEPCTQTTVNGGAVWARYVDLTAPETAVPGGSIVVSINIRAQELAIKP